MEELEAEEGRCQINLTDGDAQLMKGTQGIVAGYNTKVVVSPLHSPGKEGPGGLLITAVDVVREPTDHGQLAPLMDQAAAVTGKRVACTLADAGYHSGETLEACDQREQGVVMPEAQEQALRNPYHKDRFSYDPSTDIYTCPEGQMLRFVKGKLTRRTLMRLYRGTPRVCRACPAFGLCTKSRHHGRTLEIGPHDHLLRQHREWMATQEAKELYRKRQGLAEPVFGISKDEHGMRRFLLRDLHNVRAEAALCATAFNLRSLWRARTARRQAQRTLSLLRGFVLRLPLSMVPSSQPHVSSPLLRFGLLPATA